MNNILPKPPKMKTIPATHPEWTEMERHLDESWLAQTPECSTSGDQAYTIPSGSNYHGVTALTSARALTIPSAEKLKDGQSLTIQDESGSAGTHTISFVAAGTDTIYGATTITSNYGRRVCIKRGKGKWYCA